MSSILSTKNFKSVNEKFRDGYGYEGQAIYESFFLVHSKTIFNLTSTANTNNLNEPVYQTQWNQFFFFRKWKRLQKAKYNWKKKKKKE